MQMDVKDMSFFPDESFNCVIDKGIVLPFINAFLKVEKFELSAFYVNNNFSLLLSHTWGANPLSRNS